MIRDVLFFDLGDVCKDLYQRLVQFLKHLVHLRFGHDKCWAQHGRPAREVGRSVRDPIHVFAMRSLTDRSLAKGVLVALSATASTAPIRPLPRASPMLGFSASQFNPASNFGVSARTLSINPSFMMTSIAFRAMAEPTGWPDAVKPVREFFDRL